ncbi:MAG: hypothetical protein ACLPXT_09955 [Terracidiphilus sp.]
MNIDPHNLPLGHIITAIGALGTAAFGLLEALKPVIPWINLIGFGRIRATVAALTPDEPNAKQPVNALPQNNILKSLLANWVNGTDLAGQKAIAKSLVKLHLSAGNAHDLAVAINVDPQLLTQVATSIVSGTALTQSQSDAYARFDLIVTAMLDEIYQYADQYYRNWTRGLAAAIAVVLAFAGGWIMAGSWQNFWLNPDMFQAILIGMLATPLAPIAKDLSSGLAAAVNTMQLMKK